MVILVKCIKSFGEQIKENEIYLVLEIYCNLENQSINYRIIDSDGYPALYREADFVIVSGKVDNMIFAKRGRSGIISHDSIQGFYLNKNHVDGFWGLYFDEVSSELEDILQEVVIELANSENIEPPILQIKRD
ncbi:hypothetical protein HCA78_05870 [Listeria booriae]|uniref:Uncharacterized protein n=1 Tax=Listeria booriae TaxID=1552123 RepID=A0A842CWS3_9LIST|nr:hypothetical protein [Listeria booriae]MBC2003290.1 hypothetical protein [Listeria booriae]